MPGLAHARRQATSLSSTTDTLRSLSSTRSWASPTGMSKKRRKLWTTKETRTYSEDSMRSNCKLGKSKESINTKFMLIPYSPCTQKITAKSRNDSTISITHATTFTVHLSRFHVAERKYGNIKRYAVWQFQMDDTPFLFDFVILY